MSFFIRNLTTNSIELNDLGLTLEGSADLDLTQEPANSIAISDDLVAEINGGSIIVLDPLDESRQLDVVNSVKCVQLANDPHFGIQVGFLDQLDDVDVPAPTHDYVLTYDLPSKNWQAKISQGGGGSGDSTSVRESVTQTAHGYVTGQAVYHDGTQYELALADNVNTLATGVIEVTGNDTFDYITDGDINSMSNLTAGSWYYLSELNLGEITITEGAIFSNPVGYAESTTKFHVVSMRATDLTGGVGGNQGDGASVRELVVQNNHGFNTNQAIYYDGTTDTYQLAIANNIDTLATGMVEIVDINSFYYVTIGDIATTGSPTLISGSWYYLSDIILGEITTVEPSGLSNPLGYYEKDKFHVVPLRAMDLTGGNGNDVIIKKLVVQNSHGFVTGNSIYFDMIYKLAKADTVETLGTSIAEIIDLNSFYAVDSGSIENMSGLIQNDWYYTSSTTAGILTNIEPSDNFSNPMGYALSTNELRVVFARAVELTSTSVPDSDKKIITQVAHGFIVGTPVYFDGLIWQKAIANSVNSLATEMVKTVIDVDNFEVINSGYIEGLSLIQGDFYYTSDSIAGTITNLEGSQYSNPMGIAETTSKLFLIPYRAVEYINV